MIRIWISNKNRDRIEREFLADARNAPTGLFHTLAKEDVQNLLDEACPALYRCLYHDDAEHTVNEAEVQRLLLADRSCPSGLYLAVLGLSGSVKRSFYLRLSGMKIFLSGRS